MNQTDLAALAIRYRRDGFVLVHDLVGKDTLDAVRERTRAIACGEVPSYPDDDIELEPGAPRTRSIATVRKLNRCIENDAVLAEVARRPEIIAVVTAVLGPDIKVYGSQCFMKPPGGVEKPYHQDSAYFPIHPMELVTCWLALDDVTVQNGAMHVIPGSHCHGLIDHGQEWMVGDRRDKRVPEALVPEARETAICMPAGSCSFHHSLLLHRSLPNQTERSRRGFAVHYMSARSKWVDPVQPCPVFPLVHGRAYDSCV